MLFSFAVRSVYMESCSMFVRGGVYVVVRDSMGPFVARLSVSSLVFDYILTGPISSVSAGQYLGRLINEICEMTAPGLPAEPELLRGLLRRGRDGLLLVEQHQGDSRVEQQGAAHHADHHRDGGGAADLVPDHAAAAGATSTCRRRRRLPTCTSAEEALGWFEGTIWPQIPFVALMIAFGHSLLSMSGFETLAQVYREIAYPKLKNLKITANIICVYAVISTGVVTMFAGMIIPDAQRKQLRTTT